MIRDDEFLHIQAGGGGFGDPLERDPQKILQDVMNEFITLEYAFDVYGVVIRDEEIDQKATEIRRTELIEKGDSKSSYLNHFYQTIGVDQSASGTD